MDFTAHRRVKKTIISDSLNDLYPHDLTMYVEPPGNVISLSEFEDIALERLQLFRILEQAALKGHKLYSDDWKACIKEDLTKAGLKKYSRQLSGACTNSDLDYQARRADHISHFILRLAYCRSEDLRRWFLSRELEWFRLRFIAQSRDSIKNFLQNNNFLYTPISEDEKSSLREELTSSTAGLSIFETTEFYKIPFTEVCSLVRNRKVFLKQGLAYIPASELVVCVLSRFRASLSEGLNVYNRRLPLFDDDRINPLLSNLHNLHTGNNYYTARDDHESLDPANIDAYSKRHFPLCMRHMHEVLRADHHLKHQCRLSYGLFLKGIGLLYEDAMRFWREEFTKKMDSNQFEKNHAYNIKHSYGKVGRMLNYSPYSCIKIIMSNVGPGEHHGCPFKHWDPPVIKQKMLEYGISNENANEIKELVTNGHYQVACGKYFEFSRGKAPTNGINHPNQYFEESMNIEKEASESKK
jgi:DNA primase large subunit